MKYLLSLFLVLISLFSFSQPIIVNPNAYSIDGLVNQVLINSPCVSGFNVTSKNGNQFGSTNSISYFENQNSNFPIAKGVVLSTGNVARVPSPNSSILSDGNSSWTGDLDLESNLLSQSGITVQSTNATYLEFDFIPKTPLFDFSFIFASEEYGASQCSFSDSFAFLLKDVTTGGSYLNLAVIPSTTIPILVTTIRDGQYNSNCPSANVSYFGSFNGSGFGPAINFNGQTILMNASAAGLDVTHTYHIKIVIADGANNIGYDSAIFLAANSFNVGQNVLGLDYISANSTGLCANAVLPTLNAAGLSPLTTFTWLNGTSTIAGQTSANLNLETLVPRPTSGINSFSVVYTEPNCIAITDEISVQIYPSINVMTTLPTIYSCAGSTPHSFDLESNTPKIIVGSALPVATVITYFASNNDAITNVSALSSPHFTTTNQTIYARINSTTTSCYLIKSFLLNIVPDPIISGIPPTLSVCANTATLVSPNANFNLTASKNLIFGSQSQIYNKISYHSTFAGSNTNTDLLIPSVASVLLSISRTLYVRIQNISNPNCYTTTSFELLVKPKPFVDTIPNTVVCSSFTLPTLVSVGAQYSTLSGGSGSHPVSGDIITPSTPSNFINMYVSNSLNGCTNQILFKITKIDVPVITPLSSSNCNRYVLPNLPYGKYYTLSNGAGSILPNGTIITTTTTLYVRYEGACTYEKSFVITIYPLIPLPNYPPIFSCNDYILPVDANGGTYYSGPNKLLPIIAPGTPISSTTTIWVYKENTNIAPCSSEKSFIVNIGPISLSPPVNITNCTSYTLPDPLISGAGYWSLPNGEGTSFPVGSLINATTTLYYYVTGQSCTNDLQFTVTIKLAPLPDFQDTTPVCDVYYLPVVTSHTGNYYTGTGGTGTLRLPGFPVTSTQTMYFYESAIPSSCFVEESFLITVNQSPLITVRPNEVFICNDNYILDDLNNGEYYQFSGGLSTSNPVLPPNYTFPLSTGQTTIYVFNTNGLSTPNTCISEYSIAVKLVNSLVNPIADQFACDSFNLPAINLLGGDYYTETNGPNGIGTIVTTPYAPITSTTTLYLYKESIDRITCSSEDVFTINIQTTPIIDIRDIQNVNVCNQYILPPLFTQNAKYYTGINGSGTEIQIGTIYTAASQTIYVHAVNGSTPNVCSADSPLLINVFNVTEPLTNLSSNIYCGQYTLTPLTVGNYFTGIGGTGLNYNAGQSITTSQSIYVFETAPTSFGCSDEYLFSVNVIYAPTAFPIDQNVLTVCDIDIVNDGFTPFTLTNLTSSLLGNQTGPQFSVQYFATYANATATVGGVSNVGINPVTSIVADHNLTSIFYSINDNRTLESCKNINTIGVQLNVNELPKPLETLEPHAICVDPNGVVLQNYTIQSNLSPLSYSFVWMNSIGAIVGNASTLTVSLADTYTLIATSNSTGCDSQPMIIEVINSQKAIVTYTVSNAFENNQIITVIATGVGIYEFQIDGGPFQSSPIFENQNYAISHTIVVRDTNECGSSPLNVVIVNYPKLFTPNGDSYNDTWAVYGISQLNNVEIIIYNRYGKIIKVLNSKNESWDGTLNNEFLPADDYWFTVSYIENGNHKEFKSHFSLKR